MNPIVYTLWENGLLFRGLYIDIYTVYRDFNNFICFLKTTHFQIKILKRKLAPIFLGFFLAIYSLPVTGMIVAQ